MTLGADVIDHPRDRDFSCSERAFGRAREREEYTLSIAIDRQPRNRTEYGNSKVLRLVLMTSARLA